MNIPERIYALYTDDGPRGYLGASEIGKDCDRALWYTFRDLMPPITDGRLLRLFDLGHREEAHMAGELRAIGLDISTTHTDGKQYEATLFGGHFQVHADGIIDGHILWENKTSADKYFKPLEKKGMPDAQPVHHCQCQMGMGMLGLDQALYTAENKNTSHVFTERADFKPDVFESLKARAKHIIEADQPSPRPVEDPSHFQCKMCSARGLCHGADIPAATCKTCAHSTPVTDGSDYRAWSCSVAGTVIPPDVLPKGCPSHLYIPDLLPWEPVESEDGYVAYEGGVCNCTPDGFPIVSGKDAPACYTSQELASLGNGALVVEELHAVKKMFGGEVVANEKP